MRTTHTRQELQKRAHGIVEALRERYGDCPAVGMDNVERALLLEILRSIGTIDLFEGLVSLRDEIHAKITDVMVANAWGASTQALEDSMDGLTLLEPLEPYQVSIHLP